MPSSPIGLPAAALYRLLFVFLTRGSFPQVLFPWLLLWIANCVLPEPRGISGSMKIGRTILIAVSESCCSPAKENRLTGAKVIGA